MAKAKVILFRASGKYYTQEEWEIPEKAIGPYDMANSKDFHMISNGPVLVPTQEPWGYPFLIVPCEHRVYVNQDSVLKCTKVRHGDLEEHSYWWEM